MENQEEKKEEQTVETVETKCYKIYVHIKPIILNMGNGQQVVVQEEDNQIYKRYAVSEDAVREMMKSFLCQYYHNDWEITQIELDKSKKV